MAKPPAAVIQVERIASRIYLIRGEKVMFDSDLAELYGVETGALVRAVKRNSNRFPEDFSFQLSEQEFENLRCQFGTSKQWGGRRYPPHAFTEQGVAMLSSALRSDRAAEVNVAIIRTFVRLREILATHRDVARKVEEHDKQIAALFSAVQKLLASPDPPKKYPIGYVPAKDD
jgi:phage regulator Rha-like protein